MTQLIVHKYLIRIKPLCAHCTNFLDKGQCIHGCARPKMCYPEWEACSAFDLYSEALPLPKNEKFEVKDGVILISVQSKSHCRRLKVELKRLWRQLSYKPMFK